MSTTIEQVPHSYTIKRKTVSAEDLLLESCAETLHVSPEDLQLDCSFLAHGGNSISALALSAKFKQHAFQIPTEVILTSPSLAQLIGVAANTTAPIGHSFKRLKPSNEGSRHVRPSQIRPGLQRAPSSFTGQILSERSRQEGVYMTEMQRALLNGSCQSPGTNLIQFAETYDSCHIPALEKAWRMAMESEPIFQQQPTTNAAGDATLKNETQQFDWSEIVCSTQDEFEAELASIPEDSMIATRFRAITLRSSSTESDRDSTTVIWIVNHALIDGYSAMILYDKVRRAAEGAAIQPGTPFEKVACDIEHYRRRRTKLHKAFWRQKKIEYPQAKGSLSLAGSIHENDGPRQLSTSLQFAGDLQSWCASHNVTLASLHYSVWALILSAYVDSDTVVFGTAVSGRNLDIPGVEDTIGPLVNTLPFYVHVDEEKTCESFVQDIFAQLLEWNQVQTSVTSEGFSRNFGSSIAMEIDKPTFDGFEIQSIRPSFFDLYTDIPLSVTFSSSGRISFRFISSHVSMHDVEMMSDLYNEWLKALTSSSDKIGECLGDISKRCYSDSLLRAGHIDLGSTFRGSVGDDLVTLFEKTVGSCSDCDAVEYKDGSITYVELDRRAGDAAAYLSEFVRPQEVVCVHADRSLNWIIAIYAILKLGAIYAPLDPTLPGTSKTANYKVAKAVLYLTSDSHPQGPLPEGARIMSMEDILGTPATKPFPPRTGAQLDAAAYVCFTSGSTGKPKAVLCHHRGLVAFQRDETVRLHARPGMKIAQIMSPAFDGSIHEIFSALSYGATLVLQKSNGGMQHLADSDSAILTPSVANVMIPDDYPRLQFLYLVGEPVPQSVCDVWANSKRLFNMYGPTESTGGATIKELYEGESVTIGQPNPSSRIYILDRHQRPCPPNVVGDIYTAGIQVASGYMGNETQTSARFLPDRFRPTSGEMMYWTGDRGCWTYEQEIRCLGRSDRQIKLNGFRLDLNLLEEQIREEIPEVHTVGLVKKMDFLQAAVTPSSLDASLLKAEIAGKLPAYALPRYVFPVNDLPKTSVGKTDYHAIESWSPCLEKSRSDTELTETEVNVSQVLQDVFKITDSSTITPLSAIADLGGNSLTLVACANQLSTVFGRSVGIKQVIEARTVRDLALAIEQLPERRSMSRSQSPQIDGVSIVESEWFRKHELDPQNPSSNVSVAWNFDPETIDRRELAAAWDTVLGSHRILRSYYQKHPTEGLQRLYHESPPTALLVDDTKLSEILNKPFRLDSDHLIRVYISHDWMAVIISHVICDLTTLRNLLESVAFMYSKKVCLISDTTDASRFGNMDGDQYENLDYWTRTLSTAPKLRMWAPVPPRRSFRGTSNACWLPSSLLGKLDRFNAEQRITLHQLALGAVSLAMQHDERFTDIVLGAPFRNRKATQMSDIGLFLEPLPIRVKYDHTAQDDGTISFLQAVRRASQSALANTVPWSRLLQLLGETKAPPHNPFFDLMVTFHDYRGDALLPFSGLKQLQTWSEGSKFKLMLEFSAYSDEKLMLRVEYDDECFSEEQIDQIQGLIGQALSRLIEDLELSELCDELSSLRTSRKLPRYEKIHVGSLVETS